MFRVSNRSTSENARTVVALTISILLTIIGVMAVLQGIASSWTGAWFARFADRQLAAGRPAHAPPASVLLPCKGVDARLVATLESVRRQDYSDYELICAVESADDPAYEVIQQHARLRDARLVPLRCVVAERADRCSQKIMNLLAAMDAARSDSRVWVFLDSDAVPRTNWLAEMVGPLGDETIGAVTGYRWYSPRGSLTALLRCAWNAVGLTFLGSHRHNFCWGGSTAIRRETFDRLGIGPRWRRAVSEDYELTRAVRDDGLRIHFAVRCLLPSGEDAISFVDFWKFARRQFVLTRVCNAKFWKIAVGMCLSFCTAFWGNLLAALLIPSLAWRGVHAAFALTILGLAMHKSIVRTGAAQRILREPGLTRGLLWIDALGAPLLGLLFAALMLTASCSRRFWWRGIHYEMRDLNDVVILQRRDDLAHPSVVR